VVIMSHRSGSIKKTFDLGKYIIVRLKKGKNSFEMVCDPEEAWNAKKKLQEYRIKEKKDEDINIEDLMSISEISLRDIFPTYDVYANVKKGDRSTESDLMETFKTIEDKEIAAAFVLNGDFAWTQSQRKKWVEKKKKKIISILARNCINPQSKKPHPAARLEKAMDETRVTIDLNKTAEEQIEIVLKQIQVVLPIRMEIIQMAVKVPANYAAKAYNTVEKFAHVKNSEWQTDGSWIGVISLPAGLQIEFLDKLNKLTHGRVQTKLLQK
jgi:ribosome maturation protein SDO1